MNSRLVALLAGAAMLMTAPVWATTTTWSFASPAGTLGNSQVYTVNGVSITAYGFSAANSGTNLFGKAEGGDENGVGIASEDDHEISGSEFVQFDLSQVLSDLHPGSGSIQVGSVQSGEGFQIWGSNSLGSPGTALASGGSAADGKWFSLPPNFDSYKYLGLSATGGDVLAGALSFSSSTVPEPATFWMFTGALGLGLLMFRRFRLESDGC